jgi:hypothetical protein
MFDRLCRGDQGSIQNVLVSDLARDFVGFLYDTVDRWAVHFGWRLTQHLEDLFQPLDLPLVSVRCFSNPCLSCASVAFSIIVGNAFVISFSA